jgi:hypothetical protein
MNFLSALHGGAIGGSVILPDTLRLVEAARRFQKNETRMARMALGNDAELDGFSVMSDPRILAYAEENGLMERPVREIIARMRDERLRREAEESADAEPVSADVAD